MRKDKRRTEMTAVARRFSKGLAKLHFKKVATHVFQDRHGNTVSVSYALKGGNDYWMNPNYYNIGIYFQTKDDWRQKRFGATDVERTLAHILEAKRDAAYTSCMKKKYG
jgi:hypothetical protein